MTKQEIRISIESDIQAVLDICCEERCAWDKRIKMLADNVEYYMNHKDNFEKN